MNRGVLAKVWRETWPLLAIVCPAIVAFEVVLMFALRNFAAQALEFVLKAPFLRALFESLLGARIGADLSATSLAAFGLVHPAFLAISWAALVTFSSRLTSEFERGTADLFLTLPVSRTRIYASTSLVCAVSAATFALCAWLGIALGCRLAPPPEPVDVAALRFAAANLAALCVAISIVTVAVSTFPTRRGYAIGIVTGALAVSLLLNFVAGLVPMLRHVEALGLLHYYRPLEAIRADAYPWGRIAALGGIAAGAWIAGWLRFRTRDIPAA